MIALALVHQGLDVSAELELQESGPVAGVGHRGGDRLVVTAPADRAALEWALALAGRAAALTVGPPEAGAGAGLVGGRGAERTVRIWDDGLDGLDLAALAPSSPPPSGGSLPRSSSPESAGSRAPRAPSLPSWPRISAGPAWTARSGSDARRTRSSSSGASGAVVARTRRALAGGGHGDGGLRRAALRAGARPERGGGPCHEIWTLADLGLAAEDLRAAARLRVERLDWPRPRPRRTAKAAAPSGPRSAADRLRQLVGGGAGAARAGPAAAAPPVSRVAEGDPRTVADRILSFLEQQGFV